MKTNNTVLTVAGIATGDMSASFNSDPIRLENMIYFSISAIVTLASSLNGTAKLQQCNDLGNDPGTGPQNISGLAGWVDITGSSQTLTANGAYSWNYNQGAGFRWVRLLWTSVAGTGTAACTYNVKGL